MTEVFRIRSDDNDRRGILNMSPFEELRIDAPPFAIGNTPVQQITVTITGVTHTISIKEERLNEFGSMKDRVAWTLLSHALRSGEIKEGDLVVDSSSGNYGYALSNIAKKLNIRCAIVSSNYISEFNKNGIMKAGAEMLIADEAGGGSPHQARAKLAREVSENNNGFFLDQYNNSLNPKCHEIWTAPESLSNVEYDACFICSSSGGSASGFSRYINRTKLKTKLYVVEPQSSACFFVPSQKLEESLFIPGFGSQKPSAFSPLSPFADVIRLSQAQTLAAFNVFLEQKIADVGISGAGAILGAIHWLAVQEDSKDVICICADGNIRYRDEIDSKYMKRVDENKYAAYKNGLDNILSRCNISTYTQH